MHTTTLATVFGIGMINMTVQYPFLLSAVYFCAAANAGTAANNGKFLRGRRILNDVFSAALRVHDTASSSPLPPQRRRARADNLLDEYVHQCSTFLTSENVVADGIISQDEFVDFMIMQCQAEDVCPEEMKLKFEQLDINVQLKFVMGVCSQENFTERSNCIYDLHDQWLESKLFGFSTNDGNENTPSLIHSMCTEVYVDAVKMGLTRTTEPTSSPSTSNMPSAVPTMSPSRSLIPSTSPSNHPNTPLFVTFAPIAIADVPSSASIPMSAAPTNSESSTAPSHGEFLSPSSMPSDLPPGDAIDVDAEPPLNATEDHDSFSRDTIIVAAALALTLVIAGSLYTVYNHPPRTVTTKETCADPTHDLWDSTMSSVPHACLGINQSISSSSCSFRDDRFINVFSSEGSPIPQFNPSTANIVVIGTVSIGSSSFSSDFPRSGADYLANDCGLESPSSRSCRRSFRLKARKKARFRHRYVKSQTLSRGNDHGFLPPSPRSVHSSKTMPMTLSCGRKLHSQDPSPSDDGNISLCDWKAVSYMSSEFCCGSSATGAAAAAAHKNFFFDLFTADNTLESVSCHSLPVIPRQFSFASSESDVGVSSVLSESFFKAESSYIQNQSIAISLQSPSTPINVLVPWRKGGFSQEMELSDSNRSESSDSSVTYVALPLRNKRGLFGPSKRLFAAFRKKTKAKFSLRSKQYQNLRGVELHEDPSILSMSNSYLSETNLTAEQQRQTPTKPPKVFLGTFAAAAMPFSPDSGLSLGAGHEPTLGALSASNASNYFDQTDVVDLEANEVIQGGKSDSASAFSRSQFESSKGWSSCSCLSSDSSSDSSSAGSQWHNGNLDCSFAEAIAIDGVLSDTTGPDTLMEDKADLSQIFSESESSEALEVSDSSEVPEEEESHESFIGTIQDLSRDSLALSSSKDDSGYNTSLLPHLVSYSSEDMSFPSDELSPVHGLTALKRPKANIVSNSNGDEDECPVETDRRNTGLSSDECAANVIEWAIKNETKKLEGNIPL